MIFSEKKTSGRFDVVCEDENEVLMSMSLAQDSKVHIYMGCITQKGP